MPTQFDYKFYSGTHMFKLEMLTDLLNSTNPFNNKKKKIEELKTPQVSV